MPERVYERPWFVVVLTIAVTLVGAHRYTLQLTPRYTSTAILYLDYPLPGPPPTRKPSRVYQWLRARAAALKIGFPAPPAKPLWSCERFLHTQAALLKCRPILAETLADPNVGDLPTFDGIDNPAAYLRKILTAKVGDRDDIIRVSVTSPYPEDAARIANAVVVTYMLYHTLRGAEVPAILRAAFNGLEKAFRSLEREWVPSGRLDLEDAGRQGFAGLRQELGCARDCLEKWGECCQRLAELRAGLAAVPVDAESAKCTCATLRTIRSVSDETSVQQSGFHSHVGRVRALAESTRSAWEAAYSPHTGAHDERTADIQGPDSKPGATEVENAWRDIAGWLELIGEVTCPHHPAVALPPFEMHILELAAPAAAASSPNRAAIMALALVVGSITGCVLAAITRRLASRPPTA